MVELAIRHGVVLVDDADISLVQPFAWVAHGNNGRTKYAVRSIRLHSGKMKQISMHRMLMGVEDPKVQVDHINGNGLDNRRENMRLCSARQNSWNRPSVAGSSSRFIGVTLHRETGRWQATIRRKYLGLFIKEVDAAAAYNAAAREMYGEYARLNETESCA